MPPFLQFHALAAKRSDGLRPELRVLFERLTEASQAASVADGQHLKAVVGLSSGMASDRDTFPKRNPKR